MPVLFVYGMPDGVDGLTGLTKKIRESVLQFEDFEITTDQVSVFYPNDRMTEGLGAELVVMVDGFFALPKRTFKIRTGWADMLRDTLVGFAREHVRHCRKIEVFVRLFDPNFNTYALWEPPKQE